MTRTPTSFAKGPLVSVSVGSTKPASSRGGADASMAGVNPETSTTHIVGVSALLSPCCSHQNPDDFCQWGVTWVARDLPTVTPCHKQVRILSSVYRYNHFGGHKRKVIAALGSRRGIEANHCGSEGNAR